MTWAKPGVKCVCVRQLGGDLGETCPVVGETYTVRELFFGRTSSGKKALGIRVEEIVNRPHLYDGGRYECAFIVDFFRPLVPPKTIEEDVALFTPLLSHKTKVVEPA